jgi:hemoglobin
MTGRHARRIAFAAVAAIVVIGAIVLHAFVQAQSQASRSLYTRLGGYDAIAAVTDDFVGRLAGDPQLGKFFVGHSTDSLHRIRQLVVDQLCAATGGPCFYIGRDMKTSHKGLGISEADWQVAVKHLVASLDKFKVPPQEKNEVLGALTTLKSDIVEKP